MSESERLRELEFSVENRTNARRQNGNALRQPIKVDEKSDSARRQSDNALRKSDDVQKPLRSKHDQPRWMSTSLRATPSYTPTLPSSATEG
jgi:hypothetical protein